MGGIVVSTDLRVTLISTSGHFIHASASDRSKLKREARFICITIKCVGRIGVEQILAILAEFTSISFLNRRQTLKLFL